MFGSILVDSSKAEESISKTEKKAEGLGTKLGNGIKTAAKWGAAIGAGAVAAGAALFGLANKATDTLDRIDKLSQKIGLSRQGFQEWEYILSQSGTDIEKLQVGLKTMVQRMDETVKGTGQGAEMFKKLGISVTDSTGAMKSQEQVFEETVRALQGMPEGAEKSRLAFELFGKAGMELMPMLNGSAESIDELKKNAHDLGLVISDEAVDAGVLFQDTMDDLKRSLGAVVTNLGASVIPMFQKLAEWIKLNMPEIQAMIRKLFDGVRFIVEGFVKFWDENGATILSITSKLFEILKRVVSVGMDIIKGIIDVVMGIIQGDWSKVWNGMKTILEGAFNLIKYALRTALDGLLSIMRGAGSLFRSAGRAMFEAVLDGMKGIWGSISSWVSDKVSWLADKLAFWRKSEQEMATTNTTRYDGSHARGLAYVPFDGYTAQLHKGERVLTAEENRSFGGGDIINQFNISEMVVRDDGDIKKIAKELFNLQKSAGRGLGLV